jgi:hypothetical protein
LRGVNLSGANLSNANLSNARLDGGDEFESVDISYANLKDTVFTQGEDPANDKDGYIFDLSTVLGLDTARFGPGILARYIDECFAYAHVSGLPFAEGVPGFVDIAIEKMRFLHRLCFHAEVLPELVNIVNVISLELMKYVQSNPGAMDDLQPRQFECLIAEVLASYDWEISLAVATRDRGCDIFALNADPAGAAQSWIIECKQYRQYRRVDVDAVHALYRTENVLNVGGARCLRPRHIWRTGRMRTNRRVTIWRPKTAMVF